MPTISINEREVEAREGETVLEACERHGVGIPTLCHLKHLTPTGSCRLCVVEVEGQRALVPSCAWPVADGMKVRTHSARAVEARRVVVELLLANHPDDCLYCGRNADCDLRELSAELGVQGRRFHGARLPRHKDVSSPAIVRDPAKCILCGRCVRVCEEVQGVGCLDFIGRGSGTTVGPALDQGLNVSSCVNCGQCLLVCPTGALSEHPSLPTVLAALADPARTAVVQHAPAVALTLGEEFGLKAGTDVAGLLNAALRRLGFARVYETAFAADLTVMEEASELVKRLRQDGPLPMFTSCSPGWIKYVEQTHPDFIPNLSTCKSPQMMLGALLKSPRAAAAGLDPERVFSVSIMPCVAKKFEAARPELHVDGVPDVDAVLTTRELVGLLRQRGLDLARLSPEPADDPFGARSTAGRLFAGSGGVMESALRTAHWLLTGKDAGELKVPAARAGDGVREVRLNVAGLELGAAVVSGLGPAKALLAQVRAGRRDLHFIEVMTCPGGCLNGGGQVRAASPEALRARQQALYALDRDGALRTAHANESIKLLYDEFLGAPLGEASHHYLHTRYAPREVVR